jgi:hypothetical protein
MSKTLVVILNQIRSHELTFDNFKKNVIDELNADLCLCIGVKPDYNYENPFYTTAKYKFLYNEPDDFADAFDYADSCFNKDLFEKLNNVNTIHSKLDFQKQTKNNIKYIQNKDMGKYINFNYENENKLGDGGELHSDIVNNNIDNIEEIVYHNIYFKDNNWKNQLYIVEKINDFMEHNNLKEEENVITYKRPINWREFLKIGDQFMGGIKDPKYEHPGSAGILIFFRWFLLKNLTENNLIAEYDRFVITRSDYIYQLPHPKLELMNENFIWLPDNEYYGGYTDRHAVLSRYNIKQYLNILNCFILRSNEYYMKMAKFSQWNLEKVIKFHLEQNKMGELIREFPYIMYSIRSSNGTTRWMAGVYNKRLGYFIKYSPEFEKSTYYKNLFDRENMSIDNFYRKYIKH